MKKIDIAAHSFAIPAFIAAAIFPTSMVANFIAAGAAAMMSFWALNKARTSKVKSR